MSEFIKNNPIFSFIAVPVLLVLFVVLIIIVLRPRGVQWDYFSKLYHTVLEGIEALAGGQVSFNHDNLKSLLKLLNKMKFYFEMLESEELYEVEGIIKNIEKATEITKALLAARIASGDIYDYLTDIDKELKEIRKVLYSFNLTREDKSISGFSGFNNFNSKKSKKKAEEYLQNLKNNK